MPGGEQETVAFAEWDVEPLAKAQQHVSSRLRAAGLDEAQMARRYARIEGKL
jgi:hypothetical protein